MILDALAHFVFDVVVKHVSYAIGYMVITICSFGFVRCEPPDGRREEMIYCHDGKSYLSSNATRIVGIIPVFAGLGFLLGSLALHNER